MFTIVYASKMQVYTRGHSTLAWLSPKDEGQTEHVEISNIYLFTEPKV